MYDINPLALKLHLAEIDRQFALPARRQALLGRSLCIRLHTIAGRFKLVESTDGVSEDESRAAITPPAA